MKKRILGNEKGQALILVVGILAVVALLTSAALAYSKGQSLNAIRQKKQMQAYYIADAGITKAIAEIKSNPSIYLKDNVNMDLKGPVLNNVVNYGGGIIKELTLKGPVSGLYTLTSKGKYPNPADHPSAPPSFFSEKKIIVKIKKSGGGGSPQFDMAVFALNSIDMGSAGSAKIDGNAGTNTTAAGGVNFPWSAVITGDLSIGPDGDPLTVITHPSGSHNVLGETKNLTATRSYLMPDFSVFPSDLPVPPIGGPVTDVGGGKRKLTVGNWPYQNVTIDSDACYDEIEIKSNYTLTIDVGSGERKIRVRDLDIQQGHIVLTGTGTLTLYVDQRFNLHGTINNGGASNRVSVYYNGSTEVTSGGSNTINGTFFANIANITITNGAGITGCILTSGSTVTVSGDASATIKVLYAPNATVTVSNSGKIRGAVIANNYKSSGSGLVTYDPTAGSTYPFGGEIDIESWQE